MNNYPQLTKQQQNHKHLFWKRSFTNKQTFEEPAKIEFCEQCESCNKLKLIEKECGYCGQR